MFWAPSHRTWLRAETLEAKLEPSVKDFWEEQLGTARSHLHLNRFMGGFHGAFPMDNMDMDGLEHGKSIYKWMMVGGTPYTYIERDREIDR